MSTKKKGTLTTSGEWAKHLRKFKKRKFWKSERKDAKQANNFIQKDVPHPGEILHEFYIQQLLISKKQLSKKLNLSENDLSRLLNGEMNLTLATAIGLEKLFNATKEYWIKLQQQYDESTKPSKPLSIQNTIHASPALTLRATSLKVSRLIRVTELFELNPTQTSALADLCLGSHEKTPKKSRMSKEPSEVVIKLELLYDTGLTTFDYDKVSFKNWLKSSIPALNNQIPNDLLATPLGIDMVKDELLRIEYGII